jgi:hypothetical protein
MHVFETPTTMNYGIGTLAALADAARQCGQRRPLRVTDPWGRSA